MESGEVDGGGLLVAGGNPSPLFEAVDASLDGVALLVCLAVEGRRPAAVAAPTEPVALLVGWDRDDRPNPPPSQVFADGPGGVRLVGQNHVGPNPGTSDTSGDAQTCHHFSEGGRVAGLSGRKHESQRPAVAVGSEVDLRSQPASGAADGVVRRLVGWSPFLRAPAAC